MGWKASCILVNERQPGFLGTMPAHDPERAQQLLGKLGMGKWKSLGLTTFEQGIYPEHFTVGAYDGAAIIGDPQLGESYSSVDEYPLMLRILDAFPKASILGITLHSVVNLFGYYLFENGKLQRAYAGTADDGVQVDEGELQPEERPFFEKSTMRDGERYFTADINGQMEEFDASCFGETLVFEMAKRFFGKQLDRVDIWDLAMEAFEPPKRVWWNPFSR